MNDEHWKTALESMIKVARSNGVPFQDLPQGDQPERLRIQYYKQIATKWMTTRGDNVLTMKMIQLMSGGLMRFLTESRHVVGLGWTPRSANEVATSLCCRPRSRR